MPAQAVFPVYVFDAYGTLFDVHSAVRRVGERLGPSLQPFSDLWRARQLEYSWIRTMSGRYRDFWHITEDALDYCFQRFPEADRALKPALLDAYATLDAFPEAKAELEALKAAGAKLAILSNGTPAMLEKAVTRAGLAPQFDAILSVDGLSRFKTVPATYELATSRFGCTPGQISFQSSNGWDIAGATAFGFRCVWINRQGLPLEYRDLPPRHVLPSLTGLSALREGEA
ncbi:haloacid dehalogenase type II [Gellertiella hungarica]|uniref:(S)-2-haloacid dehalogenase n=1 Tax=Gellertiella hungarica TaxID=1572859 RepID=A0A7W6J2B8_9HYPH|nr:haloacid dehalogenase type II [Gellertiella hungarica]MBB4063494.1 2-haloacid dehalogenase [Gellertiella hungarica]